jgi:hypothetical protein
MSHWNYRVVEKDGYYGIHEAYYDDKKDKPHSITKNEVSPFGETLDELKSSLQMVSEALDKPVLHYEDF